MRAGDLRDVMTVERRETLGDDFDPSDAVWNEVQSIYASKQPLRGSELVAASQVHGQTVYKITFRWSATLSDLSTADRLRDSQ